MKRLIDRLKESLLDDDDILDKKSDNELFTIDANEPYGKFRRCFKMENLKSVVVNDDSVDVIGNVIHRDDRPLNKFYPGRNILNVDGVVRLAYSDGPVSNLTTADKIYCNSLITEDKSIFNNISFFILKKRGLCMFGPSLENKHFDNVYINTKESIMIDSVEFPTFNNFRTTSDSIYIRGNDIFSKSCKLFNKFFIFPHKCAVYEYGISRDIIIRNFKDLKVMAKSKKYKLDCDYAFKLDPNATVKDILGLNCPTVDHIEITDNVVRLQFDRNEKKQYDNGNILGMTKNQYTKDGWKVTINTI